MNKADGPLLMHFLCHNKVFEAGYSINERGLLVCTLEGCKTKVKCPLGLVSDQGLISGDSRIGEAAMTEITWRPRKPERASGSRQF